MVHLPMPKMITMIRAGAALDVVNVEGNTPLEHAIKALFGYNNYRTYPILLRAGARLPDLEEKVLIAILGFLTFER